MISVFQRFSFLAFRNEVGSQVSAFSISAFKKYL